MTAQLNEIADRAGVSLSTASRVVNGKTGVSERTRKKVEAAIDVLGYSRPSALHSRRAGLIGVVIAVRATSPRQPGPQAQPR